MSVDLSTVILPGAQSLVSAILGDAWAQVRSTIARRWGHGGTRQAAEAEQRLDYARSQALELAGQGPGRRAGLELYWAGYLAGLLAERPDLISAVQEITADQLPSDADTTHNVNSGTVRGNLLQAGDIQGSVTFEARGGSG